MNTNGAGPLWRRCPQSIRVGSGGLGLRAFRSARAARAIVIRGLGSGISAPGPAQLLRRSRSEWAAWLDIPLW